MKRVRIFGFSLALGLLACSTQQEKPVEKTWLEKAQSRETADLNPIPVQSADSYFTGTVLATGMPTIKKGERYYNIDVPIGAGAPAHCFIYQQDIDPAASLRQLYTRALKAFPQHEAKEYDAGVLGKRPYIYHSRFYIVEQKGEKRLGELKIFALSYPENGFICFHDEIGYRKTFRRFVEQFAESMKFKNQTFPDPVFREVSVVEMAGKRIGFEENSVYVQASGFMNIRVSAMLMPLSKHQATSTYHVSIESLNARGKVISGKYLSTENGKTLFHVQLKKGKRRRYRISGIVKGKRIRAKFKARRGLASMVSQKRSLAKIVRRGPRQKWIKFESYSPALNPRGTLPVHYKFTGEKEGENFVFENKVGSLKMTVVFDRDGSATRVMVPVGKAQMVVVREYVEGSL